MSHKLSSFNANFPSTYSAVASARQRVAAFAADSCALGATDVADIVLAVGEACNNAAEHGHVPGGMIGVRCTFNGRTFRAEVSDNGSGFAVGLTQPELDGFVVPRGRGRGIPIMRALMDHVTFARTDSRTTVVLEKRVAVSNTRIASPHSTRPQELLAGDAAKARGEFGRLHPRGRR